MAVKRIFRYLQDTRDKGLVFNPSNKMVVDCYINADFTELWGNEDPRDPICADSNTEFVVTFSNCTLLWVLKIQKEVDIYELHYEYVELSCYVRDLLPLNSLVKEVIDNLEIDSEKLKFVSRSSVYEDNNGAIVVATSPSITLN